MSDSFQLIALDLDGTTLNNHHELSEKTIKILRDLSSSGITVCIATGRSVKNIEKYIYQLDLPQKTIPVVLYNGAYGFFYEKSGDGKWIYQVAYEKPLPEEMTRKILAFAERHNRVAQYYNGLTGDVLAVPKLDSHFVLLKRYENLVSNAQKILSTYQEAIDCSLSAKVLVLSDNETLDEVISAAKEELPVDQLTVIKGSPDPFFVEFLRSDVTKGDGLKYICEMLNIPLSKVVAFGDGDNDSEMLQYAGLGCAMKNAKDLAKESANIILEWTNHEEGVANKLEDLMNKGHFD